MLGKLRTMLLILALSLSTVSCSGTFRIGMGSTPTPVATSSLEAHATLQAAVEARLTAAAQPSTPTPRVDVESTLPATVEATVTAQQDGAMPGPTAILAAPSEFPGLLYSTYLGGGDSDNIGDLAVDREGNLYILSTTSSPDLPTTPGAHDGSYNGGMDAFVAKLSSDGSTLLYSTYLGGSDEDRGYAIAVDDEGNVFVTGHTLSTDFPTTSGALDTSLNGGRDAFVAKLSPVGDDLVYSTYLGGDSWEYGLDITVDGTGDAYVAGFTHGDFPTTPGAFQTTFGGAWDGYVAKLNMDGSALLYSTYLGGMGGDLVSAMGVDETGKVYVTGGAASTDFPTTPDAWDRVCDNCQTDVSEDGFVAKLNTDGSDLIYSTFIGGSTTPAYPERFDSIAIDDAGNAYVAGRTTANDFPMTTSAFQTGFGGGSRDAILVKLNPDGSALLYSTYLGGSGTDDAHSIIIDSIGNAYLTGRTTSTDFPSVNPLQATNGGAYDAFVVKVNVDGSTLLYSTYFGGSADENAYGSEPHHLTGNIALDDTGSIHFSGTTRSQDLPTTAGAYDVSYNGGAYDGFVVRLNPLGDAGLEPTGVPEATPPPSPASTAEATPSARSRHAMASLGGDKVLLFAGEEGFDQGRETWVYDLNANSWTDKSPAVPPPARYNHAMASLGGGQVLLFGGWDLHWNTTDETWVYDLGDNTWTNKMPTAAPSARKYHAMAYIGEDKVLLFGGRAADGYDGETWVYDLSDNTWTRQALATAPSPREFHAMAYLGGDQVLLFGGNDGWYNGETWVYDLSDNTWTDKSPAVSPFARELHAMTYLGGDQALLFGGLSGRFDRETWVYDLSDNTWTRQAVRAGPSGRVSSAMAYLGGDQVILFGGELPSGSNGETWVYDLGDNAWTSQALATVP